MNTPKFDDFIKFRMADAENPERDLETLHKFYAENPTKFVKDRGNALNQAISDEKMLMGFDRNNSLKAITGEFEHNNGYHREIGSVHILLDGYGLQTLMMSVLISRNRLIDPPDGEIFAITEDINIASQKGISRSGFSLVNDLVSLNISTKGFPINNPVKRYYLHQEPNAETNNKIINSVLDKGGIDKNGRFLKVQFDIPFINMGYTRLSA